jgi:hypothetical protein
MALQAIQPNHWQQQQHTVSVAAKADKQQRIMVLSDVGAPAAAESLSAHQHML